MSVIEEACVRIAIIGDTHGRVSGIKTVLANNPPEHIIHTGDYFADAKRIAMPLKLPFHAVTGNCDAKKGEPDELLLELAGRRIYVAHGHQYGVKRDLNSIWYRGQEMQADIVIFGHTHIPHCEKVGETWLLNPGSTSRPRIGKSGSYIRLAVDEQAIDPEVCKIKP